MPKTLSMVLWTTPYTFQNTSTAIKLAGAALKKGHKVNLFASGDGVHNFTCDQKAAGIPNAEKEFAELMKAGLNIELCGTCLNFRGIKPDNLLEDARPSTMKNLFEMINKSDILLTLEF
ncbi:MAG: DsrE family protein [Spirochaetota bacterium]